ncbi:MAG: ATP-binding cassette domain-containing protein [Hyphomicrobiaceae bacterium]
MLRIEQLKAAPLPPLTFTVGDGECLVVEGPSGSGKTRLLRAIADLDPATGHVFLNGGERNEMPAPHWRKKVRYLSAEPQWWGETPRAAFTALANDDAAQDRLRRLVTSLGLDVEMLDKPIASLSTGQRQRLALIRGIIDEPAVLLLDEPISALDLPTAALVAELLRFQLLAGRTLIVTAHNDNPVSRLGHARLQLAPIPGMPPPRLGVSSANSPLDQRSVHP